MQKIEKNKSCIQEVKPIIPQLFQIVPHVIVDISWTFHKKSIHLFCRNIANRHAAAPRWETVKQSSQAWNSLASYFLCCPRHFIKNSWKSVCPFSIESTRTMSMEDVGTWVLEKKNKEYLRSKDKPQKIIWCIKTYIIAYVKIQKTKWRYIIHYVKPTAQLYNIANNHKSRK